jgi:hypothetical protein
MNFVRISTAALLAALFGCDQGESFLQGSLQSPEPSPSVSPMPNPDPSGNDLYTGVPELEKYILKFIDDAQIQGVDVLPDMKSPKLEVRIASLDAWGASTIGLCETSGGLRRVTFDPDFWNRVSETQREILAHHELGHCVLYRGHRSATLSSGLYASVMYPIIMGSSTYTGNYDYYQDELFTYGLSASAEEKQLERVHICDERGLGL